jgi:hypothetical protein
MIPPGIAPPEMVLNIDVAPTVLDLCGVSPPEEMDGLSWRPLIQPGVSAKDWREDFMFEYWDYRPTLPSQLAVRTDRYKLITYQDFPERELYDLEVDPKENQNVVEKSEYADILVDMEARLDRLIEETGWSQRRFQPVNNCYGLGPLDAGESAELREMVFSTEFDPEQEFEFGGRTFSWEKAGFGSFGTLDLGGSLEGDPGQVLLLSIPVRKLVEEDPHAILDLQPARATKAWHEGEMIWECQAAENLGLSYYNFPLREEYYTIRLEMSCEGPSNIRMLINAPEGTLSNQ